jgi:hypothetical protein
MNNKKTVALVSKKERCKTFAETSVRSPARQTHNCLFAVKSPSFPSNIRIFVSHPTMMAGYHILSGKHNWEKKQAETSWYCQDAEV